MSVSSVIESRAADAARLAEKLEFEFTFSRFLSPAEQNVFYRTVSHSPVCRRLFFFGGCAGADRRRAVFIPSYIEADAESSPAEIFNPKREAFLISALNDFAPEETLGISPVHVSGSSFASLSHRDYMGSVLGLGIDRAVVGDIAVLDEHSAVIFVDENIAMFIAENLTKVARDTVKCRISPVERDFVIPRSFTTLHLAAGSARIDSIAASLGNLSRSEAKELCAAGSIEKNYVSPIEPDDAVSIGDVISVRGSGKFVIDSFDGETRSGRLKFTARRYT